jgi:hypothetical protein
MTMNFYAIYDKSTLDIKSMYSRRESLFDGLATSDPHIQIPSTINHICSYIKKENDVIIVVEDIEKKQQLISSAFQAMRKKRNELLQQCDWVFIADSQVSIEQQDQWRQYRQALRDLPSNVNDPLNVVWPIQPN